MSDCPPGSDDVVLVRGPTGDGQGVDIVRKRGERLELGELRAAAEGKSLHGELVRLHARSAPGLYDVEVVYDTGAPRPPAPAAKARAHAGPARVATDEYRDGWERVFAQGTGSRSASN